MCVRARVCACVSARVCAHGRMQRFSLDPNLVPLGVLLSAGGLVPNAVPHKVQVLNGHHVGRGPPVPVPRPALLSGAPQTSPGLQVGPLRGPSPPGPTGNRNGQLSLPSHRRTRRKGWQRLWRRGSPASETSKSCRLCLKLPLTEARSAGFRSK